MSSNMTANEAKAAVEAGMRTADAVWAMFRSRAARPGEMDQEIAARNPGVETRLWKGIVDGWLSEYRTLPAEQAPRRYRAYLGFEAL